MKSGDTSGGILKQNFPLLLQYKVATPTPPVFKVAFLHTDVSGQRLFRRSVGKVSESLRAKVEQQLKFHHHQGLSQERFQKLSNLLLHLFTLFVGVTFSVSCLKKCQK